MIREGTGLKGIALLVTLLSLGIGMTNASEQEPGIPKGSAVSVEKGFGDLPQDIKAKILAKAAKGRVKELIQFGTISRSFHEAMQRVLKHQPIRIDIAMITPENIHLLRTSDDLELKISDSERQFTTAQWNEKLKLIGQLKGLKMLDLNRTEVRDLSPLIGLKSLIYLNLRGSKIKDLSSLNGLKSLMYLHLSGSKIKDLSPLIGLTSLRELTINFTKVSNLSPLDELKSLRALIMTKTACSDIQINWLKKKLPDCFIVSQ